MTQALEPYSPTELTLVGDPRRAIASAQQAADALLEVVEKAHAYTVIGSKRHIHVEGWQTVAAFYGITACLDGEPEAIIEEGAWIGARARAVAIRNGQTIGAATGVCTREEDSWADRPRYAIESMAQTRATAKALRSVLAWVVVLAGFAPTPAEEMAAEADAYPGPRCPDHPRRKPKEWGERGAKLWKCTAKVGDGWCSWTAPREVKTEEKPSTEHPAPRAGGVLAEIGNLGEQLGWEGPQTRAWLEDNGYIVNGRTLNLPNAVKALQQMIAANATTAPY